jgi:hypothetical protein
MVPVKRITKSNRSRTFLYVFFLIGLCACGGGGGADTATSGAASPSPSDSQTLTAAPPAEPILSITAAPPLTAPVVMLGKPGNLFISEVASNYYSDDVAWFEVYNPNPAPVALSDYQLRSTYIDTGTGATSLTPMSFNLPNTSIPVNGYLVIAAKTSEKLKDSSQMVYVKSGAMAPFWNGSGSIELITKGKTADFVRFGAATSAPLLASEWTGANVAALPSGPNEHGKSIVRLASGGMADTNTAADWTLVNFATPAGLNDVPGGAIDSDRDGIPDSAKAAGGTYAGMNLQAMGARRGQRDVFMEIDYMQGADRGLTPRYEALKKIVDAFAEKNIALHIDTGKLHSAAYNPLLFNLGGGETVDFSKCVELDLTATGARTGCASFYDYKTAHFDVRRRLVFHYALFANSLNLDGSSGPSGSAELSGNDLIVTLGGYGFTASEESVNLLISMQASTLMHEFGHNFGLRHGGNEDSNYKPNHYSVMNYMYQFAGLSAAPNSAYAAERYYLANDMKGKSYCNLMENSPCSANFITSYSDGAGADLDENNLSEAFNIGRGSVDGAYADWDNNTALTSAPFARNINSQYSSVRSVLKDYNEWANLRLPFSRAYSGSNSGDGLTPANAVPRANPMNQRPHHHIVEEPLPAQLHAILRKLHGGSMK